MKWHHDLEVWKRAIELVVKIYKMTDGFPKHEMYGLSQQMRKSAVSIPSNIAEGSGRKGTKEFLQFLSISQGSMAELETQLIIAEKLGYCSGVEATFQELDEISKMTNGLYTTVHKKSRETK
jgi:four helix bundle protein